MKKELEIAKLNIEQLLKKRSELFNLRENEKIKLIGERDLSTLFSMLVYLSDEKVRELKSVLNQETDITKEISSINNELKSSIHYLGELKADFANEMHLIKKGTGKKRTFVKNGKRVSVPEKSFNKYMELSNAIAEIDSLCASINYTLKENVKTNYRVSYDDVKHLNDDDKCKYYASLAALIMCDEVNNPASVSINKEVCVDEENCAALMECYHNYRRVSRMIAKRDKKANLKNKFMKKFAKAKDFAKSLFGLRKESGVNMALKKSVAVASLSLGVIASLASGASESSSLSKSASAEKIVSSIENTTIKNFNYYDNNDIRSILGEKKFSYNIVSENVPRTTIHVVNNMLGENDLKIGNKDMATLNRVGETVYKVASIQENEDIPLDERVEENACEIIAVVQTTDTTPTEENTVQTLDVATSEISAEENDLTVKQVQVPEVETIKSNDLIDFSEEVLDDASVAPVSAELANDEIIPGFHLTFNNTTYEFSEDEIKALYYVVLHECNGSYQDALVVTSIIINRIEDPRYPDDLVSVLSAEGQFVVWEDVLKEISKYGSDFEMKEPIYNALYDCLYRGIRNNDYVEFKASWTCDYSTTGELKVQIAENGNKCHNLAVSLDRTSEEEMEEVQIDGNGSLLDETEAKTLSLSL